MIDEARMMAEDAIRCYLEGLLKDGEPIPEEPALLHEKIRVVSSRVIDRLPALTPRQLIAAPQRAGFPIHHQTGSHIHLRTPGPPPRRLVIAFHNRELAPLTVRKVVRQAGLTEEDFRGFL